MLALTLASYVAWVVAQDDWALKTKYILFLLPIYIIYAMEGAAWVSAPRATHVQALLYGSSRRRSRIAVTWLSSVALIPFVESDPRVQIGCWPRSLDLSRLRSIGGHVESQWRRPYRCQSWTLDAGPRTPRCRPTSSGAAYSSSRLQSRRHVIKCSTNHYLTTAWHNFASVWLVAGRLHRYRYACRGGSRGR